MTDQGRDQDQESMQQERELDPELEQLLRASKPDVASARPEFESALRSRFLDDVRLQALQAASLGEGAAEPESGSSRVMQTFRRLVGLDGASSGASSRLTLVPAALLVLIALFGWLALSGGMWLLQAPPTVSAAELGAANAQAWASLDSLTGTFETGGGEHYEEWVVWSNEGLDRYRRLREPMDEVNSAGEWLVSDGQEEWVVDNATGQIVSSRMAPAPGEGEADLGCASLALPSGLAGHVSTDRLDGRPMYRVEPVGVDSRVGAYWVDAEDKLVYRIDDVDGAVLWQRVRLDLNPEIPDSVFAPGNLERLGA